MRNGYYIALLALAVLGAETSRAEKISHNFHEMNSAVPATITFSNGNKTATTTEKVTYTCSGGGSGSNQAKFNYSADTGNEVCAFMVGATSATLETSEIANLDSINIYYYPDAYKEMFVSAQEDGGEWTAQALTLIQNGQRGIKLPHVGNYKIKIQRSGENFYIFQMDYYTNSTCHCLRVVSE